MSFLMASRHFLVQALIAAVVPGGLIAVGIYQLVRRIRKRHHGKKTQLQQNENP